MAEISENAPDNAENVPDNSEELPTIEQKPPEPEKKARGRPKGSKDTAPRKTRTIMELPPEPEPAPVRARSQAPRRPAREVEEPPSPPPPPSPRTLFKQASEAMGQLQGQRESARRAYWQDAISRSLR